MYLAEAYLDLLVHSAPKVTKAQQVLQDFPEPQVSQDRRAARVPQVRWGSKAGQEKEAFRDLPQKGLRETKVCPGLRETQVQLERQDFLEFREASEPKEKRDKMGSQDLRVSRVTRGTEVIPDFLDKLGCLG